MAETLARGRAGFAVEGEGLMWPRRSEYGPPVPLDRRQPTKRVLVTGATGAIGGRAVSELLVRGADVALAVRDVAAARGRWPTLPAARLDVDEPQTLAPALSGADVVVYLVHGLKRGRGFSDWESRVATRFATACAAAGVSRIVYLGGQRPRGIPSRHLESRLATGRRLREAGVPTVELQASLVVGATSDSFRLVADVALRAPVLALGAFGRTRLSPVALDDVARAVAIASLHPSPPEVLAVPGPEVLTVEDVVVGLAHLAGRRPLVTTLPGLPLMAAGLFTSLLTDVDAHLAREVVQGLAYDLLPRGPSVWDVDGSAPLLTFVEAAGVALASRGPAGTGRALERLARGIDDALPLLARLRGRGRGLRSSRRRASGAG